MLCLNSEADVPLNGIFFVMYHCRISNNNRMIGNIKIHITVRCNQDIAPYMNVSNYSCIDSNINIISYMRRTYISSIHSPYSASFMKIYIVSKDNSLSNSYIIWMSQI